VSPGRRALIGLFVLTLPLVTPRIRAADEIEYYSSLRSLVFDGDLEFGNEYQYFYDRDPQGLAGFKETFLDRREPNSGRHINFAPMGAALLWSPFFLAAHAGVGIARALGSSVPADGFSWPYLAAVSFASALYAFLGLLLTHDMLVRHGRFTDLVASLAVAGVWLATPVLYYMTIAPGFGHAPSLFAVALLTWLFLRAASRASATPRDYLLVGLAGGLAGCVREQDVLFLAMPAGFLAWDAVRRGNWTSSVVRGAALGIGAFLALLPQLVAYRSLTGAWGPTVLVMRKMTFTSPHLLQVLFDPGHGLFLWSPILLLAVIGLVGLYAVRRNALVGLLGLGLLLQIWINGSIESWHMAGAFGSRRFVGASAMFAWGLAAVLALVVSRAGRGAAAVLVAVFAWWNLSLMAQFGLRLMDRQQLEWPRVAVNQFSEVPRRIGRAAFVFFTDRERLPKEGP
jgi:hypothetical protein